MNKEVFLSMSYKFLTIWILLLTSSHHSLFASSENFKEKQEMVLVRKIAHDIMRYSGDSTSTLVPVNKLSANEYQIRFETEFSFLPDSIINITHRSFEAQNVQNSYVVNITQCIDQELIFAYTYISNNDSKIEACQGRQQEESCYLVNILIERDMVQQSTMSSSSLINGVASLLVLLILGLTLFFFYRDNNSLLPPHKKSKKDQIRIGKYIFNQNEQKLQIDDSVIDLTHKEAKLLNIFANKSNELVDRDALQKEVWEDEGVIVGRSLDMFISKLRKKLSGDPNVQIKNIHGKGYKLIIS